MRLDSDRRIWRERERGGERELENFANSVFCMDGLSLPLFPFVERNSINAGRTSSVFAHYSVQDKTPIAFSCVGRFRSVT